MEDNMRSGLKTFRPFNLLTNTFAKSWRHILVVFGYYQDVIIAFVFIESSVFIMSFIYPNTTAVATEEDHHFWLYQSHNSCYNGIYLIPLMVWQMVQGYFQLKRLFGMVCLTLPDHRMKVGSSMNVTRWK